MVSNIIVPSNEINYNVSWDERQINAAEIETFLKDGYEVEIDSPDGWVPVNAFIDKGEWDEYNLETFSGLKVICNENHLFQTTNGWQTAKELNDNNKVIEVHTVDGVQKAHVWKRHKSKIPIIDLEIDHPNHRYYANGVESHNTNVGKSLVMCDWAASNLTMGYNVLYITLEMSEEEVSRRIDGNLLDIELDDLEKIDLAILKKKADKVREKARSKLIVKEFPTAAAHAGNFRHLLNELRIKKNFKPDIVYIDYLNICASSRIRNIGNSINSYTYVKAIAEEIRGLAVEFGIPIVSATQTTRDGYDSSDLNVTDTSESFGLPATADLMLGVIETEELADLGQYLFKQLKNRYADKNKCKRFVVGVHKAKMRLYDVEQEAQEDILDGPVMDRTPTGQRMEEEKKFVGFK